MLNLLFLSWDRESRPSVGSKRSETARRRTIVTVTTTTTEVLEEGGDDPEPEEEARERAPWVYWRKGVRRPRGCRCLKVEFKLYGCDGVQCRRRWNWRYGSVETAWEHIVRHFCRYIRQGVFWAALGQFRKEVKAVGQAAIEDPAGAV